MNSVLYTPWRLAYLKGEAPAAGGGCLFCNLPSLSDEEALVVFRGRTVYALLNRYPYTNGHVMVTPFAHRGSLAEMSSGERAELMEVGALCETALRDLYGPHGMNFGLNVGRSAGAGVADHAHLHVVPRWDGDTNFLTVTAGARTVPEELPVTRANMAARLSRA